MDSLLACMTTDQCVAQTRHNNVDHNSLSSLSSHNSLNLAGSRRDGLGRGGEGAQDICSDDVLRCLWLARERERESVPETSVLTCEDGIKLI